MSFTEQEIEEFKVEALELLDTAEKSLLAIDSGADFRSSFDAVFRGFHNLKGASGMMDLAKLQSHTHELENIWMTFKESASIPKEYIGMFLRGIDAAKSLLHGIDVDFVYEVSTAEQPTPVAAVTAPQEIVPTPSKVVDFPIPPSEMASASGTGNSDVSEATIHEFVAECQEIMERVSQCLQGIEKGSSTKDSIDALYRDVHSLKGSSYLFSYGKLGDLAHAMESSLENVRIGTHKASPELLDGLFKSLKVIDTLIQRIEQKSSDEDLASQVLEVSFQLIQSAEALEKISAQAETINIETGVRMSEPKIPAEEISVVAEAPAPIVSEAPILAVVQPPTQTDTPSPQATAAKSSEPNEGATSIRVPVSLLDNLMTLMGEMVLVRNQVLQFSNKSEDLEFLSMSKRLNVVTSEIQGEMMKTRMQPIGNVLSKFSRVVRDLSHDLKKNITLNLVGVETELDKSLLEAIKDPLTHIVRNSCDHGIETPDIRRQSGKPDGGTINIKAYHEGGQVIIDISDDGKGLNKDVLVKKAIEKGILTPASSAKLSEKEIFNLIFAPGFSTAAKVTNVSGRGVGMDVVRTNIEKIGGTVDLSSQASKGTTIKIKIPLTLAIVPALIVKCGNGTFAIPQVKLEELVRVDQNSENKIEILHGSPVYRLRGNILPLVDLNHILDIKKDQPTGYDQSIINIAVLNAEQCSFGLIIDEIQDTADIVVKPLTRLLKSLQVYSGATILGDGSVALILDVLGISKVANLGHDKLKAQETAAELAEKMRTRSENQDFLLVRVNSPTKHALVLAYVHRLEEFKKKDIEYSGDQRVIRHRDIILPLVSANKQLGYSTADTDKDTIPVVVIRRAGNLYGIEVDEIIDTLSTNVEVDTGLSQRTGIFGNLNTKEELLVVVDPFELITKAFPEQYQNPTAAFQAPPHNNEIQTSKPHSQVYESTSEPRKFSKILVVEDTVFFRRAIASVLEKNGFQVIIACDGQEAMDILNSQNANVDLVISDIEMPRMNGFQLATNIRKHPVFSDIPMMAVSSRADKQYLLEGTKVGFDTYLEKLKPALLLGAIAELAKKPRRAA